ncbi:MAG: hypothetical protein ACO23O_05405, partial [Ilumatobacteraceae bacterium]
PMSLLPTYLTTRRAPERSLATSSAGSDSLGRGMDIALTLLVFLGLGWLVDSWLGVFPLVTVILVVFAAVGTFVRLRYTYEATMQRLETERAEHRRAAARVEDAA